MCNDEYYIVYTLYTTSTLTFIEKYAVNAIRKLWQRKCVVSIELGASLDRLFVLNLQIDVHFCVCLLLSRFIICAMLNGFLCQFYCQPKQKKKNIY